MFALLGAARKLAWLSAAAVFLGYPACAADLAVKAPPAGVIGAPFSWNGFYIGGNAGFSHNSADFSSTMVDTGTFFQPDSVALINTAGTASASATGFVGGIQAGYNWQFNGWVLGVEADFNALTGKSTLSSSGVTPHATAFTLTNSLDPKWIATLRPRAGVLFGSVFLYGTGGLAIMQADYSQTFTNVLGGVPGAGGSSASLIKAGWTAGGGLEYAFANRWSVKAEYLYTKFTGFSTSGIVIQQTGELSGLSGSTSATFQMVRAGVNYHF
jgi:outer membrane immunogenic protein